MSTESEKVAKRKYNHTEKGRAARCRWRAENYERDRACNIKYEKSPKGIEKRRGRERVYKETGQSAKRSQRYRSNNPEKRRETLKQYYVNLMSDPERKERARLNAREWRKNNFEKSRATARDYASRHREEIRVRQKQIHYELKIEALTFYGNGKCACVQCGENRIDCLSLDHLNNDGYQHRKQVGNGTRMYAWAKRNGFPLGFQTLCMNCNFLKRAELWRQ